MRNVSKSLYILSNNSDSTLSASKLLYILSNNSDSKSIWFGDTTYVTLTQNYNIYMQYWPNKRSREESRRRWLETASCSLWRHCDGLSVSMHGLTGRTFGRIMHCLHFPYCFSFFILFCHKCLFIAYVLGFKAWLIQYMCMIDCKGRNALRTIKFPFCISHWSR